MRAFLLCVAVGLGSLGLTLGAPAQTRAAVSPAVYTSSLAPVAWHRGWYGRGYYRPFYRGYYGRGYYGGGYYGRSYYRPYWGSYYSGWGYPGYSSYYYGGYPGYGYSSYYGGYPYGGINTPWFSLWW